MSGWGLPTNIDTTYSDGADASIPIHQRHHDAIHAQMNLFEKDAARLLGHVLRWDGSLWAPAFLTSADVTLMTMEQETGNYTFEAADAGKTKFTSTSDTAATTYTIPLSSTVDYPLGTCLAVVQWGTGQVTLAGASASVVLRGVASAFKTSAQYAGLVAVKRFTDTWWVAGQAAT